jgi:NADPH-dependent curcumin reductase CurA
MPRRGREIQLAAYPEAAVRTSDFRVVVTTVRDPGPGEVLVRNTWTSVDPALRVRLRERGPSGYFDAFPLGGPMDGILTVGEVVESHADGFAPGDTVWHAAGWRDCAVVRAGAPALRGLGTLRRLHVEAVPPQAYLGALGGIGLTAWAGLLEAAQLRDGDVVWVSAAAGAVGGLAAQIAKALGHRVIGSAGSDAKVAHLLADLGLDAAFNYRSGPVAELLRDAAPDGIDVYFDNVGGEHLEAALGALRRWGRVALCGAVSEYDADKPAPGPRNLFQAIANDLTLRGFRGSSYVDRLPDLTRDMTDWLATGRVRHRETVFDGLERAPEALVQVLAGATTGKALVRITDS